MQTLYMLMEPSVQTLLQRLAQKIRQRRLFAQVLLKTIAAPCQQQALATLPKGCWVVVPLSGAWLLPDAEQSHEMGRLLARHQAGELRLIPLRLRRSAIKQHPWIKLPTVPPGAVGMADGDNVEEGESRVVHALARMVDQEGSRPREGDHGPQEICLTLAGLPWAKDPTVVVEPDQWRKLDQLLSCQGVLQLSPQTEWQGVAGMGAGALLLQGLYHYKGRFRPILWLQSGVPRELIRQQLMQLAQRHLQPPVTLAEAQGWWRQQSRGLLVLDDFASPMALHTLVPLDGAAKLLRIQRQGGDTQGCTTLQLSPWDKAQQKQVYKQITGRRLASEGEALVKPLQGWPLGIVIMAHLIKQYRIAPGRARGWWARDAHHASIQQLPMLLHQWVESALQQHDPQLWQHYLEMSLWQHRLADAPEQRARLARLSAVKLMEQSSVGGWRSLAQRLGLVEGEPI
uniref:Uncharacterized protein n=1 Tax=Magnetococcus massalia (strain MO-1) TaxID=451514 RepID=A0A1S7LI20_MAGMO|nr:protein of unknown function [Candidatus Magnetococcus massalia]